MIQLLDSDKENLIAAKISGKISKEEVEKIHPLIHEIIDKNKKADFYLELNDFEGYEMEGLWADLKIDSAHINDYGEMVIVGEKKWHEWAAKATDVFTGSEVKYYDLDEKKEAKEWIGF
jgi:hypothetical protein